LTRHRTGQLVDPSAKAPHRACRRDDWRIWWRCHRRHNRSVPPDEAAVRPNDIGMIDWHLGLQAARTLVGEFWRHRSGPSISVVEGPNACREGEPQSVWIREGSLWPVL